MIATRIATTSEAIAAICALTFIAPRRTNSVTSGNAAKIALANSDPPTGSSTCLYIVSPSWVPCRSVPALRCALFITCFNDTLFPATGRATVELLERLGHEVAFPEEQTCCGQMHGNTGYAREALPLVRRFVRAFDSYEAVVTPSGSCAALVR